MKPQRSENPTSEQGPRQSLDYRKETRFAVSRFSAHCKLLHFSRGTDLGAKPINVSRTGLCVRFANQIYPGEKLVLETPDRWIILTVRWAQRSKKDDCWIYGLETSDSSHDIRKYCRDQST